jgi:hypothetical protein
MNTRNSPLIWISLPILFLLFAFIGIPTIVQAEEVVTSQLVSHLSASNNPLIKPYAYPLTKVKWNAREIYICWENPTLENEDGRKVVRQAINETWEKSSALVFLGWEKCGKKTGGVRIFVDDIVPKTEKLGIALINLKDGVKLNFTFQNVYREQCENKIEDCIRYVAIHEFGHILGFSHEQNRPDSDLMCTASIFTSPDGDNTKVTDYDPNSIMNYCSPNMFNPVLSALDIAAVQYLYGNPIERVKIGPL